MTLDDEEDPFNIYDVVVNDAGDHSIWPQARPLPRGWRVHGIAGSRRDCLRWIDQHWDMSGVWTAPPRGQT